MPVISFTETSTFRLPPKVESIHVSRVVKGKSLLLRPHREQCPRDVSARLSAKRYPSASAAGSPESR